MDTINFTQLKKLDPEHDDTKILVRCISVWKTHSYAKPKCYGDLNTKKTTSRQKLIQEHGPNYQDYFPPELNVLVGKQVLWRFEYKKDHIENNNHQYQIKLLTMDESMVKRFKKDFIVETPVLETPVLDTPKTSRFSMVTNIPFNLESPITADVTAKGSGTKENGTNSAGEGSSISNENEAGDSGSAKRTIIDLDEWDEEAAIAKRNKKIVQVKLEPKD